MMSALRDRRTDDTDYIRRALSVEGGHLSIGRGGGTLYFARGSTLSGFDTERMKAECIAAGLPVIDSRSVDLTTALRLAIRSPLVAVGEDPAPPPWHELSIAPLRRVAELYRTAGAEVINLAPQSSANADSVEHADTTPQAPTPREMEHEHTPIRAI